MKIGVISNMMMGVEGMRLLLSQNNLACIAIPNLSTDANEATKVLCNKHSIPLQILKKESYATQLKHWLKSNQPDAVITAGCPYKIPANILEHPKYGFWNIHPGALPKYAGMDPVFWHVRNREKQLLITVHKMTETLDGGPILLEFPVDLPSEQTYGQVWNQIQQLGSNVFRQLVSAIQNGEPDLEEQNHDNNNAYTRQPAREDMTINWENMPAAKLRAVVDACNTNYGGAFSLFRDGFMKILRLTSANKDFDAKAGTIVRVDETGLWVQTNDRQSVIIKIVNMSDGYLSGADLAAIGIEAGEQFHSPT